VRAAERGEPQVITRHGRDVAVVIEYSGYQQLMAHESGLKRLLQSAPWPEDFELDERNGRADRDEGRCEAAVVS